MALSNTLKKQVDLPVFEWLRFSPSAPATGATFCASSPSRLGERQGRFIYYLLGSTSFFRYDTIADTYMQMASPPMSIANSSALFYSGSHGYRNIALSATSNTLKTGLPYQADVVGYKIRIISGKGVGQERIITAVSDPTPVMTFVRDTIGLGVSNATVYGTRDSLNDQLPIGASGSDTNSNQLFGHNFRLITATGEAYQRKLIRSIVNTTLVPGWQSTAENHFDPYGNFRNNLNLSAGTIGLLEHSTITVDTNWDVIPDQTSKFVIESGAVFFVSGFSGSSNYTFHMYNCLQNAWATLPSQLNLINAAASEVSICMKTRELVTWYSGQATGGSTTTLVDSSASWKTNEWAGTPVYIFTGTGRGQLATVTSNTSDTLTFPTIGTAPDTTSRYELLGYEGGTSSGSNAYNTLVDTSKSWTANEWTNYGVTILSGKGAGQERRIIGNTATALQFSRGWTVMPDNTSVYVITGDNTTAFVTAGGFSSTIVYDLQDNGLPLASHSLSLDRGFVTRAVAIPCSSTHEIYDSVVHSIGSLTGTTTITASTTSDYTIKVGDYLSIRGVINGNADDYNVTGLVQVTSVGSSVFTYVPLAPGSGTYTLNSVPAVGSFSDSTKEYKDLASSGTNTSITFGRNTPSNINGWYVSGTNVTPGTRVVSGAGTTTVELSGGAAVPSGTITFNAFAPAAAVTSTYSSGGGANIATITLTANTNANINGWYVVGTNIPFGTRVHSGAGTSTLVLTYACSGTPSGTITFYPPEAVGKIFSVGQALMNMSTNLGEYGTGMSLCTACVGCTFTLASNLSSNAQMGRYTICNLETLGAKQEGITSNEFSGIVTSGSTTTIVDSKMVWTSTASGTAGTYTLTLSTPAPGAVNGWWINSTGNIWDGARILSGAGTTTLTIDMPIRVNMTGASITVCGWGPSGGFSWQALRRVRITSGTGLNQEVAISSITPGTGTITVGTFTSPAANSTYSFVSPFARGVGHKLVWADNLSKTRRSDKGRYLFSPRGSSNFFDIIDLKTNTTIFTPSQNTATTFANGTYFAYDGNDRIYFTVNATGQIRYYDMRNHQHFPVGTIPYTVGTAQTGNKLDIVTTKDGLKYLYVNRHANQEHFRMLLLDDLT